MTDYDYKEGDLLKDLTTNQPLKLFGLEKTEMVFVEKGSFTMGANNETTEINFKQGYFIGKYPVTQELYEKVMGYNPSNFKGKYRPVEMVMWENISEGKASFLAKLNEKAQKNIPSLKGVRDFILPSEAQWEYAARGGKRWNNPYLDFAGSQNIKDVAWYQDNSNNNTMPVGLKQPNSLGIYDMSGNVLEWCNDYYVENRNLKLLPKDGSPNLKFGSGRVLRGGSCFIISIFCGVTNRDNGLLQKQSNDFGFRLVFSHSIR